MDYSLLLGIETLRQRPKSLSNIHRMEPNVKKRDFDDLMLNRSSSRGSSESNVPRGTHNPSSTVKPI